MGLFGGKEIIYKGQAQHLLAWSLLPTCSQPLEGTSGPFLTPGTFLGLASFVQGPELLLQPLVALWTEWGEERMGADGLHISYSFSSLP